MPPSRERPLDELDPATGTADPGGRRAPDGAALAAIALVAMSGVAYQVALVRVMSVVLWYHFAFLVVSMAVLGFGLSGMALVLRPALLDRAALTEQLALALAASIVAGYIAIAVVPFDPFRFGVDPLQAVWGALYVLAMMVPFLLNGLFIGVALVRGAQRAGQLYAADLVGAGVGALVTLGLFGVLEGGGALLFAAVLSCGAAWSIGRSRGAAGGLALCIALTAALPHAVPLRISADKTLGTVPVAELLSDPTKALETRWNALSRVDVVEVAPNARHILIDGGVALTRLPRLVRPVDTYPPATDFTSIGFALVDAPRVAIIGSGGGWEVAGALTHGAQEVAAIELNPAINRVVTHAQADWVGHLFDDPRVRLVTDEARAYLSRTATNWDVIVSAHTISNAAGATGALSLSENYTLTEEAFALYLSRLSPRGVLFFTRPQAHLPRLAATAARALRAQGMSPEGRMVAFGVRGASFDAGLVIAKDPAVLAEAPGVIPRHGAELFWVSTEAGGPPSGQPFRVATDDRPFFNMARPWTELRWADVRRVLSARDGGRLALEDAPVSEVSLVLLLVVVVVIAAGATAVPLWMRRRDWAGDGRMSAATVGYFGALGLGYMFAELGLVHRLGVFLGSPTLTFGLVVAGMLVASGAGAAVSQRLQLRRTGRVLLIAAVTVAAVGVLSGPLVAWALTLDLVPRVCVAAATVFVVGFALGMPFPLGLRAVQAVRPSHLALAWGVNGFASVVGSASALLIATELGFSRCLLAGGACYGLALLAGAGVGQLPPGPDES